MEESLKELIKAVRKDKRATIKAEVKGTDAEIAMEGDTTGILVATIKIIQSVRKNIIEIGIDEEQTKFWNLFLKKEWKNRMEEILKILNKLSEKADAKINIEVKEDNTNIKCDGNILGELLGITAFIKSVIEQMEEEGMNKETIKSMLNNSFKSGMKKIDE